MSIFYFKLMTYSFILRDLVVPRKNILKEIEIEPGFYVLDYGCGTGSYIKATADIVGKSGKIYALDINLHAIQRVQDIALKNQITNVVTIHSDCQTGLPDNNVDVVFLFDIFHLLSNPNAVLQELHRVLKPTGILSFSDHHMKKNDIISKVTNNSWFKLSRENQRSYVFQKGTKNPNPCMRK
ncbi:class I SAM-dependent methyltransferase [Planctomycetota bacterium]